MTEISIIIPVYNVEKYLVECLDSVWRQCDDKTEVIAINDGSTDNSLMVLQNIQKEHPNLQIVSQKNHGLGAVRNLGIRMAQGKYIYFLDSDDCLADGAMERCFEVSEKNQLDVLFFDADVFGELKEELGIQSDSYVRGDIIGRRTEIMGGMEFLRNYYPGAYVPSACLVFLRRDFLIKNSIYFSEGTYYEDISFHNKLLFYAEKTQYISDCLYKRRYRKDSIKTSGLSEKKIKDLLHVIEDSWSDAVKIGTIQADALKSTGVLQNLMILWANMCTSFYSVADNSQIRRGYMLAKQICGETIEEWNDYKDIEFIYNLCEIFNFADIDNDTATAILRKKEELLKRILLKIPLNKEKKYIGIYGTGIMAGKLIDDYERLIGPIKAKLYFINSVTGAVKEYRGKPLININELDKFPIDIVLIASRKYENAMCDTIDKLYGSRIKVIRLTKDYKL